MTENSVQKLVKALKAENNPKLGRIVVKAQNGEYSDTLSPSATPIIDLVADLRRAGCESLARRAMSGEFDATKEEWDAWGKSKEGQETFRSLFRHDN
jgi:hypothetical protein